MIEILIVIYFARMYYRLAVHFHKNKILYTLLSFIVFYGSVFLLVFVAAMLITYYNESAMNNSNSKLLGFLGIILGAFATQLTYRLLKKRWSHTALSDDPDIIDSQEFEA